MLTIILKLPRQPHSGRAALETVALDGINASTESDLFLHVVVQSSGLKNETSETTKQQISDENKLGPSAVDTLLNNLNIEPSETITFLMLDLTFLTLRSRALQCLTSCLSINFPS